MPPAGEIRQRTRDAGLFALGGPVGLVGKVAHRCAIRAVIAPGTPLEADHQLGVGAVCKLFDRVLLQCRQINNLKKCDRGEQQRGNDLFTLISMNFFCEREDSAIKVIQAVATYYCCFFAKRICSAVTDSSLVGSPPIKPRDAVTKR